MFAKLHIRSHCERAAQRTSELRVTEKQYKNELVEREGGVTFAALNRPDQRNAMSPELHYEMEEVIDWLATDRETKILVLTGVGESWCAGQDIGLYFRATQDNPQERTRSNAASHRWRWEKLKTFPKPKKRGKVLNPSAMETVQPPSRR
jgi:trans-feruloyl-CoA hydratase/vanillin synthase